MKHKLTAILAAVATLAACGAAWGDIGLGLSANYWAPEDLSGDGFFGMTARFEAELLPVLGIEARLGGFGTTDDDGFFSGRSGWSDSDFETTVTSLEAGLAAHLPLGPLALYGGGGVGAYFADGDIDVWEDDRPFPHCVELDYDTAVGAYAFAGLELSLAPCVALVGEFRYTWLETEVDAKWHGKTLVDGKTVSLDGPGVGIGLLIWL